MKEPVAASTICGIDLDAVLEARLLAPEAEAGATKRKRLG